MTVEIRYLGDGLRFRWVMGGLARSYGPEYRDDGGRSERGRAASPILMPPWPDVTAATGMQTDSRLWSTGELREWF